MNNWTKVLKNIEARINGGSFSTWFRPTSFIGMEDNILRVRVPSQLFKDWLSTNYAKLISEACTACDIEPSEVEYVIDNNSSRPTATRTNRTQNRTTQTNPHPQSRLNEKYQFPNFVVGACNQFAHAAAMAVAESEATPYNPLFLYGGVGLGKTHLMHAVGHRVRQQTPDAVVMYLSSETFMNELVNAIRFDHTHEFRNRYRNIDVLLIDDIQFLAGKERTQEEFFHTFNALYESGKKIIISSDRTPKEIPTLEERLQSRFEWGLIADIQAPDLETKIAILQHKADMEGISLDDDVAMYIASQIKSNIRELEGSLIRLLAHTSMTGKPLELDVAKQVLAGVLSRRNGEVELDRIIQVVAEQYGLLPKELLSRSNAHAIARPRQIAMYLAKKLTKASFPQIGKAFGGKHHTTVMHSVNKVDEQIDQDAEYRRTIQGLMQELR